jgi:murein DD-endopeptidase MepM/ murein hydrolase activator NlpD
MEKREEKDRAGTRPDRIVSLVSLALCIAAILIVKDPVALLARRVQDYLAVSGYLERSSRTLAFNLSNSNVNETPEGGVQAAALQEGYLKRNERIRSELIAISQRRFKQEARRKQELNGKLSELESIIEGVVALGFFNEGLSATEVKRGRADGLKNLRDPNRGALAAILHSPLLNGGEVVIEDYGDASELNEDAAEKGVDLDNGIGGAEQGCDGIGRCEDSHEKKDIALSISPQAGHIEMQGANNIDDQHRELLSRFNRFTSIMRILPMGLPVRGGKLTSGFGHRRSPFSYSSTFHYGLDIALKSGARVAATGGGRVLNVERNYTYGLMVDIQHAPGLVSRYAHLSRVDVRPGQEVRRGAVIALSGNSGRSTGPHLHYEVIFGGRSRNPLPFVQLAAKLSQVLSADILSS